MKKRILSLVLCIMLAVSLLPAGTMASAADEIFSVTGIVVATERYCITRDESGEKYGLDIYPTDLGSGKSLIFCNYGGKEQVVTVDRALPDEMLGNKVDVTYDSATAEADGTVSLSVVGSIVRNADTIVYDVPALDVDLYPDGESTGTARITPYIGFTVDGEEKKIMASDAVAKVSKNVDIQRTGAAEIFDDFGRLAWTSTETAWGRTLPELTNGAVRVDDFFQDMGTAALTGYRFVSVDGGETFSYIFKMVADDVSNANYGAVTYYNKSKGKITISGLGTFPLSDVAVGKNVTVDDLVVCFRENGILNVVKAETVSGAVEAINDDGSAVIGGKAYHLWQNAYQDAALDLYNDDTLASYLMRNTSALDGNTVFYTCGNLVLGFETKVADVDVSDYAVIIKSIYDEDLDTAYVTLGHVDNTQATYEVGKLNIENNANPYDEKNDKASDFANNTFFGMVVKYSVLANGKLDLSANDLGYTSGRQTMLGSKVYSDAAYYSSSRYDKGVSYAVAEEGELTVDGRRFYALDDSSVIFVLYGNPQYVRNATTGEFSITRDTSYTPVKAVAYKLTDKVAQTMGFIDNMLIEDAVVPSAYTLSYVLNKTTGIDKGIIASAMTVGNSAAADTGDAAPAEAIAYIASSELCFDEETEKYYLEMTIIDENGLVKTKTIPGVKDFCNDEIYFGKYLGPVEGEYAAGTFITYALNAEGIITNMDNSAFLAASNSIGGYAYNGLYLVNAITERNGALFFLPTDRNYIGSDVIANATTTSIKFNEKGYDVITIDDDEYAGESIIKVSAREDNLCAGVGNALIQVEDGEIIRVFSFVEGYELNQVVNVVENGIKEVSVITNGYLFGVYVPEFYSGNGLRVRDMGNRTYCFSGGLNEVYLPGYSTDVEQQTGHYVYLNFDFGYDSWWETQWFEAIIPTKDGDKHYTSDVLESNYTLGIVLRYESFVDGKYSIWIDTDGTGYKEYVFDFSGVTLDGYSSIPGAPLGSITEANFTEEDCAVIIKSTYDEDLDTAYVTLGHVNNTQATYEVGKLNIENSNNPYDEKNDKASDFANNTFFGMVVKYKVLDNGKLDLSDNDLGYISGKQTVLGSKEYDERTYYTSSRYDKGVCTVVAEEGELTVDGTSYYALNNSSVLFVLYGNPQYVRNATTGKFSIIRDTTYTPVKAVAYKLTDKVTQTWGAIPNMLIDTVQPNATTLSYVLNREDGGYPGVVAAAMTIGSGAWADTGVFLPSVTYTVTYDANGGENTPSAQTKYKGYDLDITSEKPTREGYVCAGWATSATGEVKYTSGSSYPEDKNVTLYAVWEVDTYDVSDYAVIIKSIYDEDLDVAYVTLGHVDNTQATYEVGKLNIENSNNPYDEKNDKASDFANNTFFGMVVKYKVLDNGKLDLSDNDLGYTSGKQTVLGAKAYSDAAYYSSSRYDKGVNYVVAEEGELTVDGTSYYALNNSSVLFVLYGNPQYQNDKTVLRDPSYAPVKAVAYKLTDKVVQPLGFINNMLIEDAVVPSAYTLSYVLNKTTGIDKGIIAAAMTVDYDTGDAVAAEAIAYIAAATQKYDIATNKCFIEMTIIDENGLVSTKTIPGVKDFNNYEIYFDKNIGKVEGEYAAGTFITYALNADGVITNMDNGIYLNASCTYSGEYFGLYLVNAITERNGRLLFLPTDRNYIGSDVIANAAVTSVKFSESGYDVITIDDGAYAGESIIKVSADAERLDAGFGNALIQVDQGEIVRVFSFIEGYSLDQVVNVVPREIGISSVYTDSFTGADFAGLYAGNRAPQVSIVGNTYKFINGTLAMTYFPEFSEDVVEQEGHYICLKLDFGYDSRWDAYDFEGRLEMPDGSFKTITSENLESDGTLLLLLRVDSYYDARVDLELDLDGWGFETYTLDFSRLTLSYVGGYVSGYSGNGVTNAGSGSVPDSTKVTSVSISQHAIELAPGESEILSATVYPSTATNRAVTWTSSDDSVATVSGGIITATGYGTATIRVTTVDGSKTDTCVVTVPQKVTGVSLSRTSLTMKIGEKASVRPIITPTTATNKAVRWSSSDDSVATVSGGLIVAVSAGTALITAMTEDGKYTATCSLTVGEPEPEDPKVSIIAGSGSTTVGNTVKIPVVISGNTGLSGLHLRCVYAGKLTLVNIERGAALEALEFTPSGNFAENPASLLWDGQDADMSDGELVVLTFSVDDDARTGEYEVSLSVETACDQDLEDVAIKIENGKVIVAEHTPGDVDASGKVDTKDIILMRRYVAGGYGVEILEAAADVDASGKVDTKDIILMRRYVAGGYGVVLK